MKNDKDINALAQFMLDEQHAVNAYLSYAEKTKSEAVREILMHIAREEAEHRMQFLSILYDLEAEQRDINK